MPLDINLFRVEKGGNPDEIKRSQRARFADEGIVDEIIELDQKATKGKLFLSFVYTTFYSKIRDGHLENEKELSLKESCRNKEGH